MKRFVYLALICTISLYSCKLEIVSTCNEISYTTPTIIDDSLDIGLFAPFEVPLVSEREYEFTATTNYKFIRVHFVIPGTEGKWISLRKLESKIFSQNLMIPKETKRVEIGIANRTNATGNDVSVYAVYNVISLEEFKSFIEDEERRREYQEIPTNEAKEEIPAYEKIVIDHKYITKYPKSLKRGETYIFEIGPFDSSYCILNAANKDCFSWFPVERNKSKDFKINYQIPTDAEDFRIALSSTSTTFIESLVSFNLVGKIEKSSKIENGENLDFCVLDRVNDRYETNCLYIPDGTKNVSIYLSNDYFFSSNKVANIIVDDVNCGNPLQAGKNIKRSDNYRTKEPDSELIDFLENRDARNLGKRSPDSLVDICVDYIERNSIDEYHKMKLVHDTLWYLTSYDWDSYNIGDYKPWDFRTVLSRGLCVCAGYSRTFVYFCEQMGIRAINILGTGLRGIERTPEEIENQNHAWTMVELSDGWYLFDLTWDCSNSNNGIRDDKYTCDNFFVKPEEFIKSHYPRNPEKQLLEQPFNSNKMVSLIRK